MKDKAEAAAQNLDEAEEAEWFFSKAASLQGVVKNKEITLNRLESESKEGDTNLLEAQKVVTRINKRFEATQAAISKKREIIKTFTGHHRRMLAFNPSRFISKSNAALTLETNYVFNLTPCAFCN